MREARGWVVGLAYNTAGSISAQASRPKLSAAGLQGGSGRGRAVRLPESLHERLPIRFPVDDHLVKLDGRLFNRRRRSRSVAAGRDIFPVMAEPDAANDALVLKGVDEIHVQNPGHGLVEDGPPVVPRLGMWGWRCYGGGWRSRTRGRRARSLETGHDVQPFRSTTPPQGYNAYAF